ncbi:MAG: hypothetical protein NVS1B11_11260 [Terriglobales bacterium]
MACGRSPTLAYHLLQRRLQWPLTSPSPAASLAICGGSSTCTVLSYLSGEVSTAATILSPGINSITAELAPASYPNPQTVQATIFGSSSALDISLTNPFLWIAQGAPLDVPLIARVLSSGNPLGARMVNYILTKGSGMFSAGSAVTDTNRYASSTLHVTSISGDVQVSACVAPGNAPCQTFYGTAVPLSTLQLQALAGTSQVMAAGHVFQPVVVRVTDSFVTPHPVTGARVIFQFAIGRLPENAPVPWGVPTWNAPDPVAQPAMPVILATSQITAQSDFNGVAALQPSTDTIQGETLNFRDCRHRKQLASISTANGVLNQRIRARHGLQLVVFHPIIS